MSQTPEYLDKDSCRTLWSSDPMSAQSAVEEGGKYREKYFRDAQFVFSRVQHHFHKKTKNGYVPLPRTCVSKRSGGKCKHDFPVDKLVNSEMRIICRGNAQKFGVRVKGKRNKLGLPLNRRSCVWQSGTSPAFAVVFRSNSHTAPNYRLPPDASHHDNKLCKRDCWKDPKDY